MQITVWENMFSMHQMYHGVIGVPDVGSMRGPILKVILVKNATVNLPSFGKRHFCLKSRACTAKFPAANVQDCPNLECATSTQLRLQPLFTYKCN